MCVGRNNAKEIDKKKKRRLSGEQGRNRQCVRVHVHVLTEQ